MCSYCTILLPTCNPAMPEIVRLTNCKICIYSGDHAPPHFHVRGPGWSASIMLGSLLVLEGAWTPGRSERSLEVGDAADEFVSPDHGMETLQ